MRKAPIGLLAIALLTLVACAQHPPIAPQSHPKTPAARRTRKIWARVLVMVLLTIAVVLVAVGWHDRASANETLLELDEGVEVLQAYGVLAISVGMTLFGTTLGIVAGITAAASHS